MMQKFVKQKALKEKCGHYYSMHVQKACHFLHTEADCK